MLDKVMYTFVLSCIALFITIWIRAQIIEDIDKEYTILDAAMTIAMFVSGIGFIVCLFIKIWR